MTHLVCISGVPQLQVLTKHKHCLGQTRVLSCTQVPRLIKCWCKMVQYFSPLYFKIACTPRSYVKLSLYKQCPTSTSFHERYFPFFFKEAPFFFSLFKENEQEMSDQGIYCFDCPLALQIILPLHLTFFFF